MLIEGVLRHYARLFGKPVGEASNGSKAEIWSSIAGHIQRQSDIRRTWEQVAHRYRDIKAQLKTRIADRNQYLRDTGGRSPCPIRFTHMGQQLMERLGPDWSEEEEEEVVQAAMPPPGSPYTLTEAFEEFEWGHPHTPLRAAIPGSSVGTPPIPDTPVMSPVSPALGAGPAMVMGHPPGPEEPPAAPLVQPQLEPVSDATVQQVVLEIRALRRAWRQQRRDFHLMTAALTSVGNSISGSIGTLNTIMMQILQRLPDVQASSSATSTPQPSPSMSRGRRGRPPKKLPPPSGPSGRGKGP
ncbi:myb-related transcription factor, partner of profilin-like [Rhinatrema bivittatum]|uniref:myb-related transcription factor, partner of profilin-like n=1 Tax=Rhinatrema bivittatum TaxID=194408 RepID=UPI00112AC848|nr:myb-related transcription factor, partner of profilin-like [Rhinatrema bivittatum]